MQLLSEERAILAEAAERLGVAPERLTGAIEQESSAELADVLGLSAAEAERRMTPIRRTVAMNEDWSAGCALLTDEMRADLRRALRGLVTTGDHSASSGVSQG